MNTIGIVQVDEFTVAVRTLNKEAVRNMVRYGGRSADGALVLFFFFRPLFSTTACIEFLEFLLDEMGASVYASDGDMIETAAVDLLVHHGEISRLVFQKIIPRVSDVDARYGSMDCDSLLVTVAGSGEVELAKYLVEERGAQVDLTYRFGVTPLLMASKRGHASMVRYLLEQGADCNAKTDYGKTAISISNSSECKEIVKLFKRRETSRRQAARYFLTYHKAQRRRWRNDKTVKSYIGYLPDLPAELIAEYMK